MTALTRRPSMTRHGKLVTDRDVDSEAASICQVMREISGANCST